MTNKMFSVMWIDNKGAYEYPGNREDCLCETYMEAVEAIDSLVETDPDTWEDTKLCVVEEQL